MKKLILSIAILVGISFAASANSYKLNNNAIEASYASAQDVTADLSAMTLQLTTASASDAASILGGGSYTKGGYLLRAFFCGSIGLHRYYMGTSKKALWAYYLCIPVVGGLVGCIDFWYVVFKGEDALSKYSNSDKFMAFRD